MITRTLQQQIRKDTNLAFCKAVTVPTLLYECETLVKMNTNVSKMQAAGIKVLINMKL
jgi:hypothetical protein